MSKSIQPKRMKTVQNRQSRSIGLMTMRTHYARQIHAQLQGLQQNARTESAAVYTCRLFEIVKEMLENCPNDPFMEVVLALNDSLAVANLWAEYSAEQYQQADKVFYSYGRREHLDQNTLEKAIMKLDDIGFHILPFGFLTITEEPL